MNDTKTWYNWRTPWGYRWYIFLVLSVVYFIACLHRISPTVIAQDLVSDFGVDATALGFMSSAYFYLYAAVQPPVGLLSDTWGPKRVTTLFTIIACMGSLLFGLAPNITVATMGRALIGIGVGGVFVPALKVFSNWFRPKEFAGMTGIFLAMGNVGNLAAALPLTYMVLFMGWRMSFIVISMVSLLMATACWAVVRNRPQDKGWTAIESLVASNPSSQKPPAQEMSALKRMGIVFGRPAFWLVTGSYFFYGGPTLAFQGLWAVPYLIDVHHFSRVQAGGLLMLMPIGFIIGSPILGILADRSPVGRKSILMAAMAINLICWAVFLPPDHPPPSTLVGPIFLCTGICTGGALSLLMTINKELFPMWLTGTAMGLMNPAAFLSTAVFQPFSGYLMDTIGRTGESYPIAAYHNVFIAIFIALCLSLIIIVPVRAQEGNDTSRLRRI